jgi:hypothetical protein
MDFAKFGGCRGVRRGERLFGLDSAVAAVTAATTVRDSAEARFLTLRENAAQLRVSRGRAARARRCAP